MRQLPPSVVLFADVSRRWGKRGGMGACVNDEREDGERRFEGGGTWVRDRADEALISDEGDEGVGE